jgi:hypothetical protein
LRVVSALCAAQFAWTLWHERALLGVPGLALAFGGLLLFSAAFHVMYVLGRRSAKTRAHDALPPR